MPRFLAMFDDAMKLHMRSDVPVGVMLSGGMDSVSIACTMAQLTGGARTGQPLHAFCYLSEDFEESQQLGDTIAQIGATIHRVAAIEAKTFWSRLREARIFSSLLATPRRTRSAFSVWPSAAPRASGS